MEPLQVQMVQFYIKNNAKESHTEEFDLVNKPESEGGTPILRRGANFYFCVRFNRDFNENSDNLVVVFRFGPNPSTHRKTLVPLKLQPGEIFPDDLKSWGLRLDRKIPSSNDILLQVHIAPDAPVGIWSCTVNEKKCEEEIYILFNPWCPLDSVYMEKQEELQEYILNESGKIWCGCYKQPKGRRWIFGQFDDIVLPAAILLLEKSRLAHHDRGSPILVSRIISAMINSVDEGGVVEGKWDGDYAGGVSPLAWTGSALIMDKYLRSGGYPVKYGQCWVFSAVVVTICRALGIPCRSVTNYVSAHDTDSNLSVDKYFDRLGRRIDGGPRGDCFDSCWNFHVWNDVWMARPDLPEGYGGWQIIDATPQELSDGTFRLGPASLNAIRKGETYLQYDTRFAYSEVNADICHFQENDGPNFDFEKLSINKYGVGKRIITKCINKDDYEGDSDLWDLTAEYKSLEKIKADATVPENVTRDVEFDLVDIDSVPLGRGFDVVVNSVNKSKEIRTVSAVLTAETVYYTGKKKYSIKSNQGTFTLKPGQREQLKIYVDPTEYINKLSDDTQIKIYAMARVEETKQTWSEEDDFSLTKPELNIRVIAEHPRVGEECPVEFSFQNPLEIPLTNCSYTVQGPGSHKMKTVQFGDVGALTPVYFVESFTAKHPGNKKVVVTFNSKEIEGIRSSTTYTVSE